MATLHVGGAGESATPGDSAAKRKREQWLPSEEEQFFDLLRVLRSAGEGGGGDDRRGGGGVTAISTAISRAIGTKDVDQVRFYYYRLVKRIDALLPPRKKLRRDDPEGLHRTMLAFWDTFCAQGLKGSSTHILGRRPGKRQKLSSGLEKSLAAANAEKAAAAAAAAAAWAAAGGGGSGGAGGRGNKENGSPPRPPKSGKKSGGGGSSKGGGRGRPKAEVAAASVLQRFRPPAVASSSGAAAAAAAAKTPQRNQAAGGGAAAAAGTSYPRSAGASPTGSVGPAPSTSTTAPGSACRGEKLGLQLVPADAASGDAVAAAGGVPMLELICRPKKALSTVAGHLAAKWRVPVPVAPAAPVGGNKRKKKSGAEEATAAMTTMTTSGVALALPLPSSPNSAASGAPPRSWRLDTTGMTVGELYERLGRPNPFRVTYALLEAPAASAAAVAASAAAVAPVLDYHEHGQPAPLPLPASAAAAAHPAHGPGWMNPPPLSSPHREQQLGTPGGGGNAGAAAVASTPFDSGGDNGDPATHPSHAPPHSAAAAQINSTFLSFLDNSAFRGMLTMEAPPLPPAGVEEEEREKAAGEAAAAAAAANNNHHPPPPHSLFAPDLSLGAMLQDDSVAAASGAARGPTSFTGLLSGMQHKPGAAGAGAGAGGAKLSLDARLQAAADAGVANAAAAPVQHHASATAAVGLSEVPPPAPMSLLPALPGGTRLGGISMPPISAAGGAGEGRGGGEAAAAAASGAPAAETATAGGVGALGTATVQAFEALSDGLGSLLGAPGDSWMAGPPQARAAGANAANAAPPPPAPLGPRPFGALFPSPPRE